MKLSPWTYSTFIILTKLSFQVFKAKDLILNDDIIQKRFHLLDFALILPFSQCARITWRREWQQRRDSECSCVTHTQATENCRKHGNSPHPTLSRRPFCYSQTVTERHSGRRELREEPMVAQIEVLKQNHKFIPLLVKNIQWHYNPS